MFTRKLPLFIRIFESCSHRFIKRVTRPMLGFKSFRAASAVLAGIELMHMIRKGQLSAEKGKDLSFAEQFYALAA